MNRIEPSSGNVYADLGMAAAEEMQAKAKLADEITEVINARGWTRDYAADMLGMTPGELSRILVGQFRGASEAEMRKWLADLKFNK
ncbi:XRE family transcriptional regulator [Paraburkholderia xenovorans]|uniref:helix-turn-helix domain-containing protein n=1 Tax=Paraburkholderia xenovorans TaxID=36873 RepID=UPI0038BB4FE8